MNGIMDRFNRWYSEYPRKVGKDQAIKTWIKLNPDDETTDAMISALSWQKNLPEWNKEREFIPHPSTWLNAGRWKDEQPIAMNGKMNGKANGAAVDEETWKRNYRERYRLQGVEISDENLEFSWNNYISGRMRQ
jgi:hypothetical protein